MKYVGLSDEIFCLHTLLRITQDCQSRFLILLFVEMSLIQISHVYTRYSKLNK